MFARYKFKNEVQGDNSTEQFVTRVKVMSKDCSFDASHINDMIRGRLVFGIHSQDIRKKILSIGPDLTLEKAVQICQTYEYGILCTGAAQNNDAMYGIQYGRSNRCSKLRGPTTRFESGYETKGYETWGTGQMLTNESDQVEDDETRGDGETEQKQCGNCGRKHAKNSCPAKGQQCHACKKWNHFSAFCRSKNVKELSDDYLLRIKNGQVFAEMEVAPSKQRINFKVDTGSQVYLFMPFNSLVLKLQSILLTLGCLHTMAILCTQKVPYL